MITGPSLCYGPGPPLPPRRGTGRRLRPGGRAAMAGLEWLVSLLRRSPTPVSLASTPRPPLTLSPLPAATSLRPYVTYGLRSYAKPRVGSPHSLPPRRTASLRARPPAVATHASATIAPQCSPAATGPPPRLTIEAAPPVARAGGSIPCGARARRSLPRRTIARIFRSREAEGARPLHRMGGGARVANRGKIPC